MKLDLIVNLSHYIVLLFVYSMTSINSISSPLPVTPFPNDPSFNMPSKSQAILLSLFKTQCSIYKTYSQFSRFKFGKNFGPSFLADFLGHDHTICLLIVLFKSLRNCKSRKKGNCMLKSNSNKIMLCGGGVQHNLVFNKILT